MRVEISKRKTRKAAIKEMPWASWVVKVVGGYKGFESHDDYMLWVDCAPHKCHFVKKGV